MRERDEFGIERPEPRELRRVIMFGVWALVLLILAVALGNVLAEVTAPLIENLP